MWPLFTTYNYRKLEKELTEARALLQHYSCNQLSREQSCDQSCEQSQVSERGLKWRLRCQTRQTNYCRVKLGECVTIQRTQSYWCQCCSYWPHFPWSMQDMPSQNCDYIKSWRLPWRHTLLSYRRALQVLSAVMNSVFRDYSRLKHLDSQRDGWGAN